jgi:hypothetical protein
MKRFERFISNGSKQHFAWVLLVLPMVLHARSALPLRTGFYSSDSCNDPPNAALLHFDGRNLNGAHSASCHVKVTRLSAQVYRLDESCPADHLARGNVYSVWSSQRLTIRFPSSFALVNVGRSNAVLHYRFCGTTLEAHHSF